MPRLLQRWQKPVTVMVINCWRHKSHPAPVDMRILHLEVLQLKRLILNTCLEWDDRGHWMFICHQQRQWRFWECLNFENADDAVDVEGVKYNHDVEESEDEKFVRPQPMKKKMKNKKIKNDARDMFNIVLPKRETFLGLVLYFLGQWILHLL